MSGGCSSRSGGTPHPDNRYIAALCSAAYPLLWAAAAAVGRLPTSGRQWRQRARLTVSSLYSAAGVWGSERAGLGCAWLVPSLGSGWAGRSHTHTVPERERERIEESRHI